MNNSNYLLIIACIAVFIYIIYLLTRGCNCSEQFWGGYFPVMYMGQPITRYGRTGFDAATDAPKMLVDPTACPINPYCPKCKGYRCCCPTVDHPFK